MDFNEAVSEAFFDYWGISDPDQPIYIVNREHYQNSRSTHLYEINGMQLLATNPTDFEKLFSVKEKTSISEVLDILKDKNLHEKEPNSLSFLHPERLIKHTLADDFSVVDIDETHEDAFNSFMEGISEEDKAQGQVSIFDQMVSAVYHNAAIVAVSSFWFWGDIIADIGIIVHPDFRHQNIGKALLSFQSKRGIGAGKLNQYRYDVHNIASQTLCKSVGFEEMIDLSHILLKD